MYHEGSAQGPRSPYVSCLGDGIFCFVEGGDTRLGVKIWREKRYLGLFFITWWGENVADADC